MSIPRRFLVGADELRGATIRLSGEELRHASVLRLREGESVEVTDGEGRTRRASAVESRRGVAILELGEEIPAREPRIRVTLAAALLDSDAWDLLVRDATQLGVVRIVPLVSERSRGGLSDGAAKRAERWGRIARESVKQCGRSVVPAIEVPRSLADAFAEAAGSRLALDFPAPEAAPIMAAGADVLLYVGPEGGWTDAERNAFRTAGIPSWSLGERALRAETAAVAALSRLLA